MNDKSKRLGGYGIGAAVVGVLGYLGFVHKPDADPMTLLGAANVQMSLARSFPVEDKEGNPNEARVKLLADVREKIRKAREQDPDLHAGIELDAHLSWMSGDYARAATLFQSATECRDSTPETSVMDRMNEARMWRASAKPEKALEILDSLSEFLVTHATSSLVQRAHVLLELGRHEDAVAVATTVANSTKDSQALVAMAIILESQNENTVAEAAFRIAAETEPLANYYLARLKIKGKDFDTGVDLLKRAVEADGRSVRSLVKHDAGIWKAVEDDQRFKDLIFSAGDAARPGR